jgi:hypothetical protein
MHLFPVSLGPPHTCRTAQIFALAANAKMCFIFLKQIRIFFKRVSKISRVRLKFRVGGVSGNTTIFFITSGMYNQATLLPNDHPKFHVLPKIFRN